MRVLEQSKAFVSWKHAISLFYKLGGVCKRIDPATDDESGTIKFEEVLRAVRAKEVVRHGHKGRLIQDLEADAGATLYIGSRKGEVCQRVYNKGREQGEGRDWLRFEFELKQERADQWARLFVEQGENVAWSSLRGFQDFRVPNGDANRGRWPVAEWWRDLMCESRHVIKRAQKAMLTIGELNDVVKKQFGRSLAKLMHAFGGDIGWLTGEVFEYGRRRMTEADWNLVRRYQEEWRAATETGGGIQMVLCGT